ncbi:MAG: TonB family protein [Hyphomicrobium sp.]|nr:TonB family protein [Hyphomicrobium sp.]
MSDAIPAAQQTIAFLDLERARLARLTEDRRFVVWLALTLLIHAILLVGFNSAEPRRLGSPGGSDDAISVSLVSSAELDGRATVDDAAAGQPAPLAPPPTPTAETSPAEPTPPSETPADQKPAEATAEPVPPPLDALKPTEAPPEVATTEAKSEPAEEKAADKASEKILEPTPEMLALPDPADLAAPKASEAKNNREKTEESEARKASEAKSDEPAERKAAEDKPQPKDEPKEKKKAEPQQQKTAKLDLTPPAIFQAPVGGGGAGVQRPAGITRSGENDDFARGVIRALQRTMPQLSNTRGRVTVRITIDMNGNLANTEVLKPSLVDGLDQSVIFATRQSSFPFPPANAKPVDLVFIVTYIYR